MIKQLLEHKIYTYKDNDYEVLDLIKLKHPISRDWVIAVVYRTYLKDDSAYNERPVKQPERPKYCRPYDEFVRIFKGVM